MSSASPADPLPGWNEGAVKTAILEFVVRVTDGNGADFVSPADRVATFDNDGTLWCEYPLQVQVFFLIDRVKALAAADPALAERQPFKALIERDVATLMTMRRASLHRTANSISARWPRRSTRRTSTEFSWSA